MTIQSGKPEHGGPIDPNDQNDRPPPSPEDLLTTLCACLEDFKSEDIQTINIQGKSIIADYMVVASGSSRRHVSSIADALLRRVKEAYGVRAKCEGLTAAEWVLIDAGDVIVHIFQPEVRAFYNIEKMWSIAPQSAA